MSLLNLTSNTENRVFRKVLNPISMTCVVSMILFSLTVMAQESLYEEGQRQLDNKEYNTAREIFEKLASNQDNKQDAALYWLAYAQFKSRSNQEALNTITKLSQTHADSVWLDDALALRVEILDASGQSVDIDNDEMKLYALNSLMNSKSGDSVEILRKVLNRNNSEKIKDRALFVLSQLNQPEAYELIAAIAKDDSNLNLQAQAIKMLGVSRTDSAMALLKGLYQESSNEGVKAMVLKSYLIANRSDELVLLAKSETNPELKRQAIHMIGVMSGTGVLLEMYRDADFKEFRTELIHGLAIGGGADALYEIIKSEQNELLLVDAVEKMGIDRSGKASEYLVAIYQQNQSRLMREAVINALFIQSNSQGLINIVKTEKDSELKRSALQKLSFLGSDETLEYFNDVLENEG